MGSPSLHLWDNKHSAIAVPTFQATARNCPALESPVLEPTQWVQAKPKGYRLGRAAQSIALEPLQYHPKKIAKEISCPSETVCE